MGYVDKIRRYSLYLFMYCAAYASMCIFSVWSMYFFRLQFFKITFFCFRIGIVSVAFWCQNMRQYFDVHYFECTNHITHRIIAFSTLEIQLCKPKSDFIVYTFEALVSPKKNTHHDHMQSRVYFVLFPFFTLTHTKQINFLIAAFDHTFD